LRRRRAARRGADVLAMDVARGSLVVLWHDESSLLRYGRGELAMAGFLARDAMPRFE
jgi:hypothetical protein